jgi:LacI family transcriptional regulator
VHQIARELNYVPNLAARALATGRTGGVALLSGALNEPYYANIAHLIEAHLTRNGYKMLLLRTRSEVKDLAFATKASSVDGAIAIDAYHLIDEFLSQGNGPVQPCVSIGTFSPPHVDHITIDLSSAVSEALRLMVAAGRKRIAYLVTSDYMASPNEVRAKTYLAEMEAAGQQTEIIDVNTIVIADVKDRLKEHLKVHGCPDGLLCQNDETAISAYRAILDMGYRIPEEVLLVGCDGLRYMEYFDPPLSTIAQPMEEMCELAWKFLQQRMAKPDLPIQTATLECRLIVRKSLEAPPNPS